MSIFLIAGGVLVFLFILLTDYRLSKISRSLSQLVYLAEEFADERNKKDTDA
jgi:hypothetical protein